MKVLMAALVVVFAAMPAFAAEQRFSRTIAIASSTPIRLDATIADLVVESAARTDVAIQIVRRAPSEADLDRFPVVVDDSDGRCRITVVQADGGVSPDLKAEIHLFVPAAAVLDQVNVFEGHVRLVNLRGTSHVAIRRGSIEANGIAGGVRLEAELGSLDIRNAELTPGGMMHLRAFNGDVRVRLARRPADARILAVTYNGSVASDLPLAMKDKFGPHFGETTIGKGDPVLSIDVVKGNIEIRAPAR